MTVTVAKFPEDGEYIGRPSPLGNPYVMRGEHTRDAVCNEYERWLTRKVHERDEVVMSELERLAAIASVRPLKLVCYCAPKRCHGETIAKVISKMVGSESELI